MRVAAVILKEQAVALIERRRSDELYYLFPGGSPRPRESLSEALAREVLEELGLSVAIGRLIAEVSYRVNIQYYFAADVIGGEFGTGHGLEVTGRAPVADGSYTPAWIPLAQLLRMPVHPRGVAEIIVKATQDGWPPEAIKLDDPGRI